MGRSGAVTVLFAETVEWPWLASLEAEAAPGYLGAATSSDAVLL